MTTSADFTGTPFVLGSIRGQRCWRVSADGFLVSPQYRRVWHGGENVSRCESIGYPGSLDDLLTKLREANLDQNRLITAISVSGLDLGGVNVTWICDGYRLNAIKRGEPGYVEGKDNYSISFDPEYDIESVRTTGSEFLTWERVWEVIGGKPPHDYATCSCGFYAYLNGVNDYIQPERVVGVIEGYGETLIGKRGFRASKAKILALAPVVPNSVTFSPDTQSRLYVNGTYVGRATISVLGSVDVGWASEPDWDLIRENYPDAAIFDDPEKMFLEFPATDVSDIA